MNFQVLAFISGFKDNDPGNFFFKTSEKQVLILLLARRSSHSAALKIERRGVVQLVSPALSDMAAYNESCLAH